MAAASVSTYLADTHSFVWHLVRDPALGGGAREVFQRVLAGRARILVSAISVVEAIYLRERQRISPDTLQDIFRELGEARNYHLVEVDSLVAREVARVDPAAVPEMPDLAATARAFNVPLITKDRRLQACPGLNTIW